MVAGVNDHASEPPAPPPEAVVAWPRPASPSWLKPPGTIRGFVLAELKRKKRPPD
jgi:hypothetical protein